MRVKEITEGAVTLRIRTFERKTPAGFPYFESRGSYKSPDAPCTIHLVTRTTNVSAERAELEMVSVARRHGWGR